MPGGATITRLYDFVDGMKVYEAHLDGELNRVHQWLNGMLGDANIASDADITGTKLKVGSVPLDRLTQPVYTKSEVDSAISGAMPGSSPYLTSTPSYFQPAAGVTYDAMTLGSASRRWANAYLSAANVAGPITLSSSGQLYDDLATSRTVIRSMASRVDLIHQSGTAFLLSVGTTGGFSYYGSNTNPVFTISQTGNVGVPNNIAYGMKNAAGTNSLYGQVYVDTSDKMQFALNGANRMTLDATKLTSTVTVQSGGALTNPSTFQSADVGQVHVYGTTSTYGHYTKLTFGATFAGAGLPLGAIGVHADAGGSTMDFGTSNSYGSGITNTAMSIAYNGNITIDSGTFFVDAVNNRVGVGSTSPATTFHVSGSTMIGGAMGVGVGANPLNAAVLNVAPYGASMANMRLQKITSMPGFDSNAGFLYVDTTGALKYLGSSGTTTQLAAA